MSERIVGKLGKLEAVRPEGLHMLAFYQTSPLPTPPDKVDVPAVSDWQMLGNDRYGDCTFAGIAHAQIAVANVLGVNDPPITDQQVINVYLAYSNGQDQGAVEADLLKFWQNNIIFNGKTVAYAPTDVADQLELKSVIHAYGLAYIGIKVPAVCQEQFRSHQPWELTGTAADNNIIGGHCIILVGYDEKYFYGITWGAVQAIEWTWLQAYMDESWAVITPEIVTKGEYEGLRLVDLLTDIGKL